LADFPIICRFLLIWEKNEVFIRKIWLPLQNGLSDRNMKRNKYWRMGLMLILLSAAQRMPAQQMLASMPQNGGKIHFIENKSQWEERIRFMSSFKGGRILFENDAVTYHFIDPAYAEKLGAHKTTKDTASLKDSMVEHYVYRMRFEKANPEASLSGLHPKEEYHNYYIGNDPSHWATGVKLYQMLHYTRLYEGIDAFFYEQGQTYKYELVVAGHADPSQIRLKYEGADKLFIKNNTLYIKVGKHQSVEQQPFAYQWSQAGEKVKVECAYRLEKNMLTFQLGDYDKTRTLIIDPTLVFASYSGSTDDNWGYSATYDAAGNLYGAGTVYHAMGKNYPYTTGAYQTYHRGGSCDIGITKFSANGTQRLFSTYLGGDGTDVPHSLVVNNSGDLFVLGTTSSSNYPTTTGAFGTTFSGGMPYVLTGANYYSTGSDIVITRFNAAGTQLLASTYYGGSGNDGLDLQLCASYSDEVRGGIQLDNMGNVYIVSSTTSSDLPVTGGFQSAYGGGAQDGLVAKFSANLQTLIWASFIGGSSVDAAYGIEVDGSNNVYLCGATQSDDLAVTYGVMQSTRAGGTDGFVAKISSNGALLALTYYGTASKDHIYLISLDGEDYVYVAGQSEGGSAAWVYNVGWNSGMGQFVSKLSNNLTQRVWSTSFGDNDDGIDISLTALMVDVCGNIHLSGWAGIDRPGGNMLSTTGLPTSLDALKNTTDGKDFYFISIAKDANQLMYATFYGGDQYYYYSGEHVDGGTSRFDKKGIIYQAVCAGCGGNSSFPTSPANVVSPTNQSQNCNLGVIKFSFDLRGVVAMFVPLASDVVCLPDSLYFDNRSLVSDDPDARILYYWDFGDGSTDTVASPKHLFPTPGTYYVRLVVVDSASCNVSDTVVRQIVAMGGTSDTLPTLTLCRGDMMQIGTIDAPGVTYRWSPAAGLTDIHIANPFCNTIHPQLYTLYATNAVCTDTFFQQINVDFIPAPVHAYRSACLYDTVRLTGNPNNASFFHWSSLPDFSDTLNLSFILPSFNAYIAHDSSLYYLKRKNAVCEVIDTFLVIISDFSVRFDSLPPICIGDSAVLGRQEYKYRCTQLSYQSTPAGVLSKDANDRLWIKPQRSEMIYIQISNEYNCIYYDSIYVRVPKLHAKLTKSDVSCHGLKNGQIRVDSVWGGKAPYGFTWMPSNQMSSTAVKLDTGIHVLHVRDSLGCVLDTSVLINQPNSLEITFVDTCTFAYCDTICTGRARAVVSGGTPPYAYRWISGERTDSAIGLCAGDYFLFVTDANQCRDTAEFVVTGTENIVVKYETFATSCPGACDGMIRIDVESDYDPIKYIWKTGQSTSYEDSLCAGVYDISVIDSLWCTKRIFPAVEDALPVIIDSFFVEHPYCSHYANGKIAVYLNGGMQPYSYFWNGVQASHILSKITQSGTYRLHVVDNRACEFDTVFLLLPIDTLSLTASSDTLPCAQACIGSIRTTVAGGVAPYAYRWLSGEQTPNIDSLCAGRYTLVVSDSNHCSATIEEHIVVDVDRFRDTVKAWADAVQLYLGQSTDLHATRYGDGFQCLWSPADGLSATDTADVHAEPPYTIVYTYTVFDQWGCSQSDTVLLTVLDMDCDMPFVFVPNAFSPNGDSYNDILYVRGDLITEIDFAVYDRWGEKVFSTKDKSVGWDGSFNGKRCEPAVYVWYLDVTCLGGKRNTMKGNVTLIR
jgi:gliding motility-associated-like protein